MYGGRAAGVVNRMLAEMRNANLRVMRGRKFVVRGALWETRKILMWDSVKCIMAKTARVPKGG